MAALTESTPADARPTPAPTQTRPATRTTATAATTTRSVSSRCDPAPGGAPSPTSWTPSTRPRPSTAVRPAPTPAPRAGCSTSTAGSSSPREPPPRPWRSPPTRTGTPPIEPVAEAILAAIATGTSTSSCDAPATRPWGGAPLPAGFAGALHRRRAHPARQALRLGRRHLLRTVGDRLGRPRPRLRLLGPGPVRRLPGVGRKAPPTALLRRPDHLRPRDRLGRQATRRPDLLHPARRHPRHTTSRSTSAATASCKRPTPATTCESEPSRSSPERRSRHGASADDLGQAAHLPSMTTLVASVGPDFGAVGGSQPAPRASSAHCSPTPDHRRPDDRRLRGHVGAASSSGNWHAASKAKVGSSSRSAAPPSPGPRSRGRTGCWASAPTCRRRPTPDPTRGDILTMALPPATDACRSISTSAPTPTACPASASSAPSSAPR